MRAHNNPVDALLVFGVCSGRDTFTRKKIVHVRVGVVFDVPRARCLLVASRTSCIPPPCGTTRAVSPQGFLYVTVAHSLLGNQGPSDIEIIAAKRDGQ